MDATHLDFSLLIDNIGVDAMIDHFNALRNIAPASFYSHNHAAYEMYFIESGTMSVRCENTLLDLKPNDILILAPGVMHNVETISDDLKRFNFRFLFREPAPTVSDQPYILYRPCEEIRNDIFQNIANIHFYLPLANDRLTIFRVRTYFSIIVSYIVGILLPKNAVSLSGASSHVERQSKLNQCIQLDAFFSEHYAEPITVEALAKQLNYSKTHVNRLLKSYWGMSFIDKLKQTRLHVAKQYLTTTALPISKIAEKCGYSSTRGFGMFFLQQTGLSPLEYRKKHTKTTF